MIHGEVVFKETGKALSGLTVEALDADLFVDDHLGSTATDKQGKFEIRYDKSYFIDLFLDPKPDIFLRVLSPSGKVLHTTKDHVRYDASGLNIFALKYPRTNTIRRATTWNGRNIKSQAKSIRSNNFSKEVRK